MGLSGFNLRRRLTAHAQGEPGEAPPHVLPQAPAGASAPPDAYAPDSPAPGDGERAHTAPRRRPKPAAADATETPEEA